MDVVFVTGTTGMLGPETLLQLSDIRPRLRLIALVRAENEQIGRINLTQALTEASDAERAARAMAMISVVPGDVTRPESLEDPRLDDCTHVLHMAANTSYWNSKALDVVNIDGTRHVADRARRMPKLKRFAFVSTAFAYGRLPNLVVQEVPFQQDEPDSLVRYSRNKARTEAMLQADFTDLPVVIIRPSIVAGHSTRGLLPSTAIIWSIRILDVLNTSPGNAEQCSLDIVPIDWAIGAINHLLLKPMLKAKIYHVSAGTIARSVWAETAEAINQFEDQGKKPRNWEHIPEEIAEKVTHDRFAHCFGLETAFDRLMLKSHILYVRFANLNAVFDNSNLLAEGITMPKPLRDLMPVYLSIPPGLDIRSSFSQDHIVPITDAIKNRPVRRWVE